MYNVDYQNIPGLNHIIGCTFAKQDMFPVGGEVIGAKIRNDSLPFGVLISNFEGFKVGFGL